METAFLFSTVSLTVAIVAQLLTASRHQKAETEARGREMGTIGEKLTEIKSEIGEVKVAQKEQAKEIKEMAHIVTATSEQVKSAHKRIDAVARQTAP
jgi:hypothetical protein